jgi:hypothetical protein
VVDDIPIDNETLFVIDFINLKIKSTQSFGAAYRGRMRVYMFIGVSTRTIISICICIAFLKKEFRKRCRSKKILWKNSSQTLSCQKDKLSKDKLSQLCSENDLAMLN